MEFYTKSNRLIRYYGNNIKVINNYFNNINNLDDLFNKLLLCYSDNTTNIDFRDNYDNINNPTYGECMVTSLIVNLLFGGTIHKIKIGNYYHYFNKINNNYIDLTIDQFDILGINLNYDDNILVDREYLFNDINLNYQYNILISKLNKS